MINYNGESVITSPVLVVFLRFLPCPCLSKNEWERKSLFISFFLFFGEQFTFDGRCLESPSLL